MSFTLQSNIPAINAALEQRASELVRDAAQQIVNAVKISMAEEKSGAIYKRKGKSHRASAPGEPPAIDLGTLVNSIQVVNDTALQSTIGLTAEYAAYLEFGTVRMAPRPYLGPAFEQIRPIFEAGMRELLK